MNRLLPLLVALLFASLSFVFGAVSSAHCPVVNHFAGGSGIGHDYRELHGRSCPCVNCDCCPACPGGVCTCEDCRCCPACPGRAKKKGCCTDGKVSQVDRLEAREVVLRAPGSDRTGRALHLYDTDTAFGIYRDYRSGERFHPGGFGLPRGAD